MATFAQIYIGLAGVQVFFLLSRAAGAPWGIFAPGVNARAQLDLRHRGWALVAGLALLALVGALIQGLRGDVFTGWAAVVLAWLWFLIVALAREEGEQLLWRPVNGIMAIAGALAMRAADGQDAVNSLNY